MADDPQRKERFDGIQIARAAAALLVVIWHVGGVSKKFADVQVTPTTWLQFGEGGVDLFFVISGFIISHVARVQPFSANDFLLKRFYRIYPFYAFFTGLALAALLINPTWRLGSDTLTSTLGIVESFFIVPQNGYPLLFVGWSLEHEALFYLIVALLFVAGQRQLLAPLLITLFGTGAILRLIVGNFWDWHLLSPFHLEFAIGVLLYQYRTRLVSVEPYWAVVVGVAFYCVTAWVFKGDGLPAMWPERADVTVLLIRVVGFGIGAGFLLLAAINFRMPQWKDTLVIGPIIALFMLLGDASYTLYLSHPFVLSLMGKVGLVLHLHGFSALVLLGCSIIAAMATAAIFYRTVEKPYLDFVHARVERRVTGADPPTVHVALETEPIGRISWWESPAGATTQSAPPRSSGAAPVDPAARSPLATRRRATRRARGLAAAKDRPKSRHSSAP